MTETEVQEIGVVIGYLDKMSKEQREAFFHEATSIWCRLCGAKNPENAYCQCGTNMTY